MILSFVFYNKNPTATNSRTAVNSRSSAFTVLNFNRKECYMEQIERYLEEIESALYRMSPTEREHLMEVLHLAFADYFENNYIKS